MTNKKQGMKNVIIKIVAVAAGITWLFFMVLFVHLYQVTHKPKPAGYDTQLCRIDFTSQVDSAGGEQIRGVVSALPGVSYAYFNHKDDILVYGVKQGTQTHATVINAISSNGYNNAKPYKVSSAAAKTGCPVGANTNPLYAKLKSLASGI